MKCKCLKCGAEFDVRMVAECPECGEMMKVKPLYAYAEAKKEPGGV